MSKGLAPLEPGHNGAAGAIEEPGKGGRSLLKSDSFRLLAEVLSPQGWPTAAPRIDADQHAPLISASSHHLVTPALAWRLRDRADLPDALREFLDAILVLNRARNDQIAAGLELIGRALNDAGLEPLLLKGASCMAIALYPDRGFRYLGDIDMLLAEESLELAQATLEGLGFEKSAGLSGPHHHLPMLLHPERGIGVELHSQPAAFRCGPIIDAAAVLGDSVRCMFRGRRFRVPSSTHRVLLSIVHDQIADGKHAHGVPGLRAMLDVALHQAGFADQVCWPEIARRFAGAGRSPVLRAYLALAEALMGVHTPLDCVSGDRAAVPRMEAVLNRSLMARRLRFLSKTCRAAMGRLRSPLRAQLRALHPSRWEARARSFNQQW